MSEVLKVRCIEVKHSYLEIQVLEKIDDKTNPANELIGRI